MKFFTIVAAVFILNCFYCPAQSNYCIPNPPSGINGYSIDSIHLESLDTLINGPDIYQFLRDSVHHETCYLTPGSTYKIYLKSGTQPVSTLGAWIDWNNDTVLASAEKLGEINTVNPNEVNFISFTVPQNCFKGKLRLRVRNSNSSSLNACNDYVSGQIFDFTITTINPGFRYSFYANWQFSNTVDNFIDGVRVGDIDNQNTGGVNGPVFGDYTYLSTDLTSCDEYYLVVRGNFTSANDSVIAFADYNKNGWFENNEIIGKIGFPIGVSTDSIQFRPYSVSGIVRLRLICYSGSQISEVEDYNWNIISSSVTSVPVANIGADLFYRCDTTCNYLGCAGPIVFHDYGCGQTTFRKWTIPGATPSTSSAKNPTFTFPSPGFYNISLIDSNSLGTDTAYSKIYISPPITQVHLGNDTAICSGSNLVLSAPAGTVNDCYSYLWSTGETTRQITAHTSGTFSVQLTSCIQSSCPANDAIAISFSPRAFNVTGGGANCLDSSGFVLGLSNSETGVNYQLKLNGVATGSPVPGTGSGISFGLQIQAGNYTVAATNVLLGCTITMNGSASITYGTPPAVFNVTGSGSFCAGGIGLPISLDSSSNNVSYQLYRNGNIIGTPINGNGSVIIFPNHTAGNYTVVATDDSSLCTSSMADTAVISTLPAPSIYLVSGGGTMCGGTQNATANLSDSQLGVLYHLLRDGNPTSDSIMGTGNAISFSHLLVSGTYTITASDSTSCISTMNGSSNLTIINTPAIFNLTGGGVICFGDTLSEIMLSGSQTGVRYQLYRDSNFVGNSLNGSGNPLDFGYHSTPGTYYVIGSNTITACWLKMDGTPIVNISPTPNLYNVTGGGHYCIGSPGALVGLSNSDINIDYQLYRNGATIGLPVHGTGGALSFGFQSIPGVYTMIALGNTAACSDTMIGSVPVFADSIPHVEITSVIPDTTCLHHSPIPLSGNQAGGIFSGPGIFNDTLYPILSGTGFRNIMYTFSDSISGCSANDSDSIFIDQCIGVDELNFPGTISLYPNPTDKKINIDLNLQNEMEISICMINSIGEFIFSESKLKVSGVYNFEINTSGFSNGIYLLKFTLDKSVFVRRIVVQH